VFYGCTAKQVYVQLLEGDKPKVRDSRHGLKRVKNEKNRVVDSVWCSSNMECLHVREGSACE
jgi:hypothetical protein